jgi:hypothetical protein
MIVLYARRSKRPGVNVTLFRMDFISVLDLVDLPNPGACIDLDLI